MGTREHLEQRGATHSGTGTPEVLFLAKMTKTPLVNPSFDRRPTRSKPSQKNVFHSFTSNPSFTENFDKFKQV